MECNVALKVKTQLGEGVWWDDRREGYFWIDITTNEIFFLKDGKILKDIEKTEGQEKFYMDILEMMKDL